MKLMNQRSPPEKSVSRGQKKQLKYSSSSASELSLDETAASPKQTGRSFFERISSTHNEETSDYYKHYCAQQDNFRSLKDDAVPKFRIPVAGSAGERSSEGRE